MLNLTLTDKQEAVVMAALYAQKDFWYAAKRKSDDTNEYDLYNGQLIEVIQLIKFIEEAEDVPAE